jgi:proline dehydrogenase
MGTAKSPFRILIERAASRYTAGPTITSARAVCERLACLGIASTVCYWNRSSDSPLLTAEGYLALLDLIRDLPDGSYLSVKAPALGFDMKLINQVLDQAHRTNTTVHFDAMSPETADRTIALIDEARRIHPNLGCTLPSRWRRSLRDLDRAIEWNLRIRLVKGEWPAPKGDEMDPNEGFLRLVERLAAKSARHVAVATHNHKLGRKCLEYLKGRIASCELELLYGFPQRSMLQIARALAIPARVYVPYGGAGLPYRLKDAARKPAILGWFVRDVVRGPEVV